MAGMKVGGECDPASLPTSVTSPGENEGLLDCFSTAVSGNDEDCTIGAAAPSPAAAELSCEWVSNGPGMGGRVVCPQQLAGLTDIPAECGYLDTAWCSSSAGTPREILMEELAGCQLLPEDAPLSEVTTVAPGYLRDGQNLPATVNMRANCVRGTYAKLTTLEAPKGWFNSASAPRTSASFPVTTYHMFHKAEGKLGLQTLTSPFLGLVLTLVWQAGLVALRVAMWAFDWATSGSVTAILAGIPSELARLLQTQVVQGLRLYEVGLLLLGTTAGWKLLRGRVADAASSVVFALLAFSLGWFLLTPAAFSGYYAGALETRQLLADGLTFGVIADTGGGGLDAAAAMQVVLDSVVHTPWEHLNFGQALDDRCHIEAAQQLLIDGIRSQADTNLDVLRDCGAQGAAMADFASKATSERLFGAVMVGLGQVAVAGLVFVAAGLALLSEVLLGAAFASLPLAVAGVLWPGGRRVAGAWFALLLRGLVGFGAGMLFLSLVMVVLAAVVGRTQGMALLERSLAFLLVAWAGWRLRKVFPKAAAQVSAQLGGKVSAAFSQQGVGGSGAGLGAAAGGLAGGFAATHLSPRGVATAAKIGTKRLQGAAQKVTGLTAAAAAAAAGQRPGLRTLANAAASTKGGRAAVEGRQAKGLAGTASQAAAAGMARWLAGRGGRPATAAFGPGPGSGSG
ncbi:MAG: hypothetical protein F4X04_01470 [Holophagales bacterium]|nr:hypothetical protein [Holophagales bacterium]